MDEWLSFVQDSPVEDVRDVTVYDAEVISETVETFDAQRELTPEMDIRLTDAPKDWRTPNTFEEVPPLSGTGLVHTTYNDYWTKIWGVNPIADLWLYRQIARTDPWVQKSLQLQVDLALQKGYEWQVDDEAPKHDEMMKLIDDVFELVQCDFEKDVLPSIAWNMLCFGSGWLELIFSDGKPDQKPNVITKTVTNIKGTEVIKEDYDMFDPKPGVLANIKSLDPCTMRVRQDGYGNIYGYTQIIQAQPILFSTDKIVQFKWQSRTVPYENAYGTSELMALLRDIDYIRAIEGDLYMAGHAIVKPPMIFKDHPGSPPLTDAQWTRIRTLNQGRKIGDDVYAMGLDVLFQSEVGSALGAMMEFYKLKRDDRSVGLGVPRNVLGIPEGSSRTTIEMNMNEFYTKIKGFQSDIGTTVVYKVLLPAALRLGWTRQEFIENLPVMEFVDVAIQDENLNAERELKIWEKGLTTSNEARMGLNLDEIKGTDSEGEDRGDKYYDEVIGMGGGFGGGGGEIPVREPGLTQPKASINDEGGMGPHFPELIEETEEERKKREQKEWDLAYGPSEALFREQEKKWDEEMDAAEIPDDEITKWVTIKGKKVPIGGDGKIHKDYNQKGLDRGTDIKKGMPSRGTVSKYIEGFKPLFDKEMKSIKSEFKGRTISGRMKTVDSAMGKLEKKGQTDPKDILDIAGMRIESNSIGDVKEDVAKLKDRFKKVLRENNYVDNPKGGYRSHHLIVEKDGRPIEIQVRTKNQTKWGDYSHDTFYKIPSDKVAVFAKNQSTIDKYLGALSNHFFKIDQGRESVLPPCPSVIASIAGCFA